jgi:hypothetical protein
MSTPALTDCRATGIALMDHDFAHRHQIRRQKVNKRRQVTVIDGRGIESGDIMHIAMVAMKIKNHKEQLPMYIMKLEHYPIVLGIPGLQSHNVVIRSVSHTITYSLQYCTTHRDDLPVPVQGVTEEPPKPV